MYQRDHHLSYIPKITSFNQVQRIISHSPIIHVSVIGTHLHTSFTFLA